MSIEELAVSLREAVTDLTEAITAQTDYLKSLKAGTAVPTTAATAAATAALAEATKGTRTRRTKEQIAADLAKAQGGPSTAPITEAEVREEVGDFLSYGSDTDLKDAAVREKREGFLTDILDWFKMPEDKGARDVPEKDRPKMLNWIRRYAAGEEMIDFDKDDGAAEPAPTQTQAPRRRSLA